MRADGVADLIFSFHSLYLVFIKTSQPTRLKKPGTNAIRHVHETDIICESAEADEDRNTRENNG